MADGFTRLPARPHLHLIVAEQASAGVHEFPQAVVEPERFTLTAWAHGYCIRDHGDLICTFHGTGHLSLAWATLKRLRDEFDPQPPRAA